jgi:hypothetical protein
MNETRRPHTFSKFESDNRWYKWLALGSFIVALGVLIVYVLQVLGVIS